jgi:hypothetical protein
MREIRTSGSMRGNWKHDLIARNGLRMRKRSLVSWCASSLLYGSAPSDRARCKCTDSTSTCDL